MASIAAALSLAPGPDPGLLDRIAPARGRRDRRRWQTPPVGLAWAGTGEPGLLVAPEAGCALAFDGRLDNRDELRDRLGTSPEPDTDAGWVLACYWAWGPAAFNLLVGDFALALWDGPRRRLACARDPVGLRPLFYHHDRRRLVCASAIRQLHGDPDTPRRLSESAVADYLAGTAPPPADTFFAGVRRLPAGHWLEADPSGRVAVRRFWDPAAVPRTEGKPAAWYADEFRDRFFRAVRARLRGAGPRVGMHVSGGFDSAAVVAAAHDCDRRLGLGLEPRAFVTAAGHPAADERAYVRAVLDRYPMPVEAAAAEDYWALRPAPAVRRWQDEPHLAPYASRLVAELEAARRLGINVILSGAGGDEVGGSSWYLLDLLARGRVGRLWPELKARAAGKGQSPAALARALGLALANWARRALTRPPARPPAWVHPGLARRFGLPRRGRRATVRGGPVRDDVYGRLSLWWTEPTVSAAHAAHDHFGVELRHPFLDRRLFEWALSVPPFRLGEGGRVKAPLRRALADLLPPAVAWRPDKGDYAHYWDLGLRVRERERILGMLARPVSADLGYVDAARLRRAYEHYCRGGAVNRQQLWNALTLEAWLRDRLAAGAPGG